MRRSIGLAVAFLVFGGWAGSVSAGQPVWGKDMVNDADFPPPFGISAVYFNQKQDYAIDSLSLGIPGFQNVPTDLLNIDNEIDEYSAKFDAWLLPWLNVFGLVGQLDGETDVDFTALQVPLQLPFNRIHIEYDGEVYGGGAVIAAGTDRFFGSVTAIVTQTSLSGDFDSSVDAFVVQPRLGLHNHRGAIYAGAMYLDATEEHKGTLALPLIPGFPPIPVPFDVKLKQKDDWNWLVGGTLAFAEHWTLQAEGGFGDREHVDVELGYRF